MCCDIEAVAKANAVKSMMENLNRPFFSIVTVCFNDKDRLARTISSVEKQECKDFEYLVIDGGSNDGTSELASARRNLIHTFLSEPDTGIYNAMNKGLRLSNGKYIHFLNAGDLLLDPKSLENAKRLLLSYSKVVGLISPVHIFYPLRNIVLHKPIKSQNIRWLGLPTSHQGIIYDTEVLKKFPFNESFRLAADYDQYLRVMSLDGAYLVSSSVAIAQVEAGGVSDIHRMRARREFQTCISSNLEGLDKGLGLCYQYIMMAYDTFSRLLKLVLPTHWSEYLRNLKK